MTYLYVPITAFSIFLSFSRFLWFVGVVSIFLSLLGRRFTTWIKAFLCAVLLVVVASAYIGPEKLGNAVSHRFFSKEVKDSDGTRTIQIQKMTEEITRFPLFGKGIGSNAGDRKDFSYEVQWISLLMQFGFVGVAIMLLGASAIVIQYLRRPMNWSRLSFLLGFIIFLLGGFTNPFLLSLNSGIMYAAYFIICAVRPRPSGRGYKAQNALEKWFQPFF
jgi:hypothetical protein